MTLESHVTDDVGRRLKLFSMSMALFFLVVAARLVQLQILQRDEYIRFAVAHGVRREPIVAQRGHLVDRTGALLVWNQPHYEIVAIPQEIDDLDSTAVSLEQVIGIPATHVRTHMTAAAKRPPYLPVVIRSPATLDDIARLLAWKTPWHHLEGPYTLRGVEVRTQYARTYADPLLASHLFGYLKEVDAAELARLEQSAPGSYARGDVIGASGLEAQWDLLLRGRDGYQEMLVDARGYEVTPPPWLYLETMLPQQGATVRLTLDARLQQAAHEALGDRAGAVVALEPTTGAVLAMVSQPSFDISRLNSRERFHYWQELVRDPHKPLYHRAIMGQYPPGSTYKIVVGTAGLAEAVITPESAFHCHGGLPFGGRVFGCWRRGGHGRMTINTAYAQSCDVFFYQTGLRLGPDLIARHAAHFGLGRPTGIDLPYERAGLIPTTAWKAQHRGAPWNSGETLSIAIGQGYDLVTPLQSAVMVATVANGGKRVRPYLVEAVIGGPADVVAQVDEHIGPPETQEQVIAPEVIRHVQQGLIDVVNRGDGTGRQLAVLGRKIAGKSGTAQVVSLLRAHGVHSAVDHAWFVAYAPYDDPKIAVAVLVEHGGGGSRTAAPVAGAVIDAYLSRWDVQP